MSFLLLVVELVGLVPSSDFGWLICDLPPTVVTGRVERGTILKGAEVEIVGLGSQMKTTLTGVSRHSPCFSDHVLTEATDRDGKRRTSSLAASVC